MQSATQVPNFIRWSVQAILWIVNAKAKFRHYAVVADFCCTDSENTVAISFSSTVRISRPKARVPAVIFHTIRLGAERTQRLHEESME